MGIDGNSTSAEQVTSDWPPQANSKQASLDIPTSSSFSRADNSLTSPISSTTEGAFSPSEEKSKSSEIVLDSCTLAQGTVEGTSKKILSPTTDDSKDIVKEDSENNIVATKGTDDIKTKEENSEITTKVIEE